MIDDVLGLVILAVVAGVIGAADRGEALSYASLGAIVGKAAVFLVGALLLGVKLSPTAFRRLSRLRSPGVLLAFGLAACFALSWHANAIGHLGGRDEGDACSRGARSAGLRRRSPAPGRDASVSSPHPVDRGLGSACGGAARAGCAPLTLV